MSQTSADKAKEHIEWMEANNASLRSTAEHFGITPDVFLRELILEGYELPVRMDDEPIISIWFHHPFRFGA